MLVHRRMQRVRTLTGSWAIPQHVGALSRSSTVAVQAVLACRQQPLTLIASNVRGEW